MAIDRELRREVCVVCTTPNAVGFQVPDWLWQEAVPARLQSDVLCLFCFLPLADERLLPWDKYISFVPISLATQQGIDGGGES